MEDEEALIVSFSLRRTLHHLNHLQFLHPVINLCGGLSSLLISVIQHSSYY